MLDYFSQNNLDRLYCIFQKVRMPRIQLFIQQRLKYKKDLSFIFYDILHLGGIVKFFDITMTEAVIELLF